VGGLANGRRISHISAVRSRPDDLPDYGKPPLNEVVLGVQFNQPEGYQQIRAGEVWALYQADYPRVEEQPALAPTFETFGGRPSNQAFPFELTTGATHDRFWFLSPTGDELIQFQADRFLHNWRKVGEGTNPYPRFERMIEKFEADLQQFESYVHSLSTKPLVITQCEVTYVNHIFVEAESNPSHWFNFLCFEDGQQPEDVAVVVRRVLKDSQGKPLARVIAEVKSAITQKGENIYRLTITVRGAPPAGRLADAIEFLWNGRGTVVNTFSEITTKAAQAKWERLK
jgi:uncharacterized protein (TIGR04255 family)